VYLENIFPNVLFLTVLFCCCLQL